jgi:hypothetical protein
VRVRRRRQACAPPALPTSPQRVTRAARPRQGAESQRDRTRARATGALPAPASPLRRPAAPRRRGGGDCRWGSPRIPGHCMHAVDSVESPRGIHRCPSSSCCARDDVCRSPARAAAQHNWIVNNWIRTSSWGCARAKGGTTAPLPRPTRPPKHE